MIANDDLAKADEDLLFKSLPNHFQKSMTNALELQSIPNRIDGASSLRQFVVELFYGWGYNAYKTENKLRADDQLVRNEISGWLGQARQILAEHEREFRREHLPPPSRENPFPDAKAVATAQAMQRAQQSIEAMETQIRGASLPPDDRTWARHRNRDETLTKLRDVDLDLAAAVLDLVRSVRDSNPPGDLPSDVLSSSMVGQVLGALDRRKALLSVFAQG